MGNPIRTLLWFFRGLAVLGFVFGLLAGQRLLSEFDAILLATVVMSFVIEPRLLGRFATPPGDPRPSLQRNRDDRAYRDAHFSFVVGNMRVVGGLFVVVGLLMATMMLLNWSQTVRDAGGTTGAVGALLLVSATVGVGTLVLLGRHVPLMRALREMGEQRRRDGGGKRT